MITLPERIAVIRKACEQFRFIDEELKRAEFARRVTGQQATTPAERLAADQLRLRAMTEAWTIVEQFEALDAALSAGTPAPPEWSVSSRRT